MIPKYRMEFVLDAFSGSGPEIKKSLIDFGKQLEISQIEGDKGPQGFLIKVITEEPTVIFDLCSQFGRIKSAKVEET